MILTFRYRLLPAKRQHRALEQILESQRQLYNAALEERIGAYRKAGVTRTYFDQCKALTEWRRSDPEAFELPVKLQRATLKRLDEAYRGFFRRVCRDHAQGRSFAFQRHALVGQVHLDVALQGSVRRCARDRGGSLQHQSGMFWLRRESPEDARRSAPRLPALGAVDRPGFECRTQHPESGRSGPEPA